MKKITSSLALTIALVVVATTSKAIENIGVHKMEDSHKVEAGDCKPATAQIDMNINNVRARLMNGGDMWWDLNNSAKYEIPKVPVGSTDPRVSSLFAGSVWIGGIDQGGQLKIAAGTYRQNGNDFFPGPLDANGEVDQATCTEFDKQWQVLGSEIDEFRSHFTAVGQTLDPALIPQNILEWPANNNPNNQIVGNRDLAPFYDYDGNGEYDPTLGDFPVINHDFQNYADQMIWWVYNDKGNIHTETGGQAIGMEVQTLAFAFKTTDEIDNMTFYKYVLLNKATTLIDSVYMGQWVDPDLGCYLDDYIGCDTSRGLGIIYNADALDQPCPVGYGDQPPLLGVDYFKGPLDENGEELGMTKFLYYNNDFTSIGNPENASHYYGYLSGSWKDGTPFTQGGNGHGGSVPTDFVFPDAPNNPTGWSECAENNTPADRRFVESTGAFKLLPGASNEIIIGVVWVRPPIGTYPCPSFSLLQTADDKAQALFDSNFKILDGPKAPDVKIVELDKKVIFNLVNTFNKDVEKYHDSDPILVAVGDPDSTYFFQGYQVFQLINSQVSAQELGDPAKSRLVAQCDVKDITGKIVNFTYDPVLEADVPTLKVDGANIGLQHSFVFQNDAFATGDKRLVNNKKYYYMVVSYAYNGSNIQKTKYLQGRKNTKIYTAIPHIPAPEFNGLILNSEYGDGPMIIRQEGLGNSGNPVELSENALQEILNNGYMPQLEYANGKGPVGVKVIDPKNVPADEFELVLTDSASSLSPIMKDTSSHWKLTDLTTGVTVYSDTTLNYGNEQMIPDWGLSVYVNQVRNPGSNKTTDNNGYIDASITFKDPQTAWLTGIPDQEGEDDLNWIRSGTFCNPSSTGGCTAKHPDYVGEDDNQAFEDILGRTWAPYKLCSMDNDWGPIWNNSSTRIQNRLDSLQSVKIVFTDDKSKWTHCLVIEAQPEKLLAQGNAPKMSIRKHASLNKDGTYMTVDAADPFSSGYSWFPGYAIDLVTGMRLNIMFSEDSRNVGENGADMIFNPTSNYFSSTGEVLLGGRHNIYIAKTRYDECVSFRGDLGLNGNGDLNPVTATNVYKKVGWVSMTMLAPGFQFKSVADGLIPTETTIYIWTNKAFTKFDAGNTMTNGGYPRYTFNTKDLAAVKGDASTAKNALDTINIVPNPYYAYSGYESSQIDNRVKITNLPQKCTISIYSIDGTLIRKFDRDDASITSLDWDLKNGSGVPIASGVYLIHISAGELGEKTLKFFGIMRPIDLDSF
ncbi:MAG: T9SS type A sorting domain-containing protein [Bacteroidota bacterium]